MTMAVSPIYLMTMTMTMTDSPGTVTITGLQDYSILEILFRQQSIPSGTQEAASVAMFQQQAVTVLQYTPSTDSWRQLDLEVGVVRCC